ncbi:MAG: prepilin peptidase [Proteobacteria bacterium]|jgi:leader peptidase (prepilin peptidase)/N-methyltransferase|nr:prepilin peptidase [Pseudomonadota bacterium]
MADLILSPLGLGILGLLIGSFLNVVVHRLPAMYMREWWRFDLAEFALADARSWRAAFGARDEPPRELAAASEAIKRHLDGLAPLTLWRPRSRCPECGHAIRALENIPVVSWLVLRGRCSACGTRIAWRYPLLEAATGILFAACAWRFGASAQALVSCAAVALLLPMALIDLEYTLLPDSLTIPLVVLGLVAAAAGWTPVRWGDAATGALVGYGVLWAFGAFWQLALHKANAMAEGDMKMLAGIGALTGWQPIAGALFLAAILGAVVGVGLIALGRHKREVPIPFGPYLALGGLAAVLFPQAIGGFGESLAPLVGL